MLTRMRDHAVRPHAGRSWLLALVVAGIIGMHGLSAAGTPAAHHVPAAASTGSVAAAPAHHASPDEPAPAGEDSSAIVVLCMVMALALALGMTVVRRTTWVTAACRTTARLVLPTPPLLRDRTPVPRFTVMRC